MKHFMPIRSTGIPALFFSLLFMQSGKVSAQDYVCMDSDLGEFCIELNPEFAPLNVANFLNYVNRGEYTNTVIHRSEPNFVIQSGGYTFTGDTGIRIPRDPNVQNEFVRSNTRGTVAMAKLGGDPDSASSEWFINLVDNPSLDNPLNNGGYTVIGEVRTGMDVVDTISSLRIGDLTTIINANTSLNGSIFANAPILTPANSNLFYWEHLVLIKRAYLSENLPNPYFCHADSIVDSLAEFCSTYITFPVLVGEVFYSARLDLVGIQPTLAFKVDTARLAVLSEAPAEFAVYNPATGLVDIPSVRVGASIVRDVVLELTNAATLEFALLSYSPQ